MALKSLPVADIFDTLAQSLIEGDAIVVAPPGAGKSTALPLFLLSLAQFSRNKIIMLQPRRVAARNIALYLSEQLGEKVGHTVGYRVRGEHKTSASTRLEIVTEGILIRMLQSSPELPGVGLVIFDEFHERSVHADFSLALCVEVQQALREDLRILVMSATLDVAALQRVLPNTPILESTGIMHPVDIQHVAGQSNLSLVQQVCALIATVFAQHQKDFLVFLPGAFEIQRAASQLQYLFKDSVAIHPLYSDLNKQQQQQAIMPDPNGKRKIVLATNIAETSLTIEGIEVVVDSGVEKKARFDLRRGITQLTTQKISQASATQRAGRAGRLMPGTCYRLWPKEQHDRLERQSVPEILQTDISNFVLEAAVWGTGVSQLALIDYPSNAQIDQAHDRFKQLGVLHADHSVTRLGHKIHQLAGSANIAAMVLRSAELSPDHVSMACAIAALLESKDPLITSGSSELSLRLSFLTQHPQHVIWPLIRQWHQKVSVSLRAWPLEDTGLLLAFGFSQWIGKKRSSGRFLLANGSGASLPTERKSNSAAANTDTMEEQDWIVVAHMQITDFQSDDALIRYAQALSLATLKDHFATMFTEVEKVDWDTQKQKVTATRIEYFGKIPVAKLPLAKASSTLLLNAWRQMLTLKIAKMGLSALPLDERSKQLIIRSHLARQLLNPSDENSNLPDLSEERLVETLEVWLLPYLDNKVSWAQLVSLPFYQLLTQMMEYKQRKYIDEQLPETWLIPTGRKVPIAYFEDGKALLSVRMQEMYGLRQHPNLLHGELAITCELLSPASRPLQTTQDIPGFWSGSYQQIQKEMKGRYPRHFWPDDPLNATPTAATKKKM